MNRVRSITCVTAWAGLMLAMPVFAKPTKQCAASGAAALTALTTGEFDQATRDFSPRVASQVSPAMLKAGWNQITSQLGAFASLGRLEPREIAGNALLVTTLTFANGKLAALVDCDADNRITTFRLAPASMLPPATSSDGVSSAPATALPAIRAHVEPDGVRVEPLAVPSPLGPLRGALTLPAGSGPFPAVVMLAGSGPQNLDETVGPNKPFQDIADGLASAGIASLRYDKRTLDYVLKVAANPDFTVDDEVTDDALTALHLLSRQKSVDPHRLFVLGHSLGAQMAPRIAHRDPQLAGVIMLAAPARPFLEVLAGQIRELGPKQGESTASVDKQEKAIAAERKLLAKADSAHPPRGTFELLPGQPVQQAYLLSLHAYHQLAVAKSLKLPMLILQGGNDYQVSPTLDFDAWKKALAGKPNVTFQLFPGLSHLFMRGPTRSPADYAKPAHVAADVIDTVATWIKAQPAAK